MSEQKKIGRLTKYSPEMLAKAEVYLDTWEEIGDVIPMLCGLACYLSVDKSTIEKWEKDDDKQEFSCVCARVRAMQEKVLINKGLSRASEASLSKLLLMKHGYSDRQDFDLSSRDGSMSPRKLSEEELREKLKGLGLDPDTIK